MRPSLLPAPEVKRLYVIYALDWEKKVKAAYETPNERAFTLFFELAGDNFTDEQKTAMYHRNFDVIEKLDPRMREFLFLKNKIRFGPVTLEDLMTFKGV